MIQKVLCQPASWPFQGSLCPHSGFSRSSLTSGLGRAASPISIPALPKAPSIPQSMWVPAHTSLQHRSHPWPPLSKADLCFALFHHLVCFLQTYHNLQTFYFVLFFFLVESTFPTRLITVRAGTKSFIHYYIYIYKSAPCLAIFSVDIEGMYNEPLSISTD